MPQGDEKDRPGYARGEVIGEDRRLLEKIDDREQRGCLEDLNGMPEPEDEQVQPDDEEVNLDLGEPSPEVAEYARRELGETEEVKCQTLQELRDMIYGNPRSFRAPGF